jgi:glucose-1-phosphate adenylyltransferase
MATIRVPIEEASRFGIVSVDEQFRVTSFVEKPTPPPSNLANMGVYIFSLKTLDQMLWEDREKTGSTHDFGKDIIPRMVANQARVYAFPFTGYWVDVGTLESYWKAHMDLLTVPPPINLNDRSWIIHTRTEERPPVWISSGAVIKDSMITDGCFIADGALIERSVLSPGVRVESGAVIRESVLLTDTVIESGAVVERSIVDKRAQICRNARIGEIRHVEPPLISMIGKNSLVPEGHVVEASAVIATDVVASDYPMKVIRAGGYLQTRRLPYEV